MLRSLTRKPTVEFHFFPHEGTVWYWLTVNARGKTLKSKLKATNLAGCAPEVMARVTALAVAYHVIPKRLPVTFPERPVHDAGRAYARSPEYKAAVADNNAAAEEYRSAVSRHNALRSEFAALMAAIATVDFKKCATSTAITLEGEKGNDDNRSFALYRGAVWVCDRPLAIAQWQVLVDRLIQREEAELACALAEESSTSHTRERIPPELRRAVWIRDQGKCARCGSRERLEYDHIIPLARGGSNTERNIELLCEGCNRTKSDSIM